MSFARAAGLLLHPTSLPGHGGIGDFGPDAHRFVQWLADAGLKIWQVLPLGPTGYGDSPYQCFSAFAGNPLLIHVPGYQAPDGLSDHTVDFGAVIPAKQAALAAWLDTLPFDHEVQQFVREQAWLPDYALFMALKQAHGGVAWPQWDAGARERDPASLASWRQQLAPAIERIYKEQYVFFAQYHALRHACRERGIKLMGDVPIYVAHDSADVWANPAQFLLHPDGTLKVQAGVPPDYFSETGQLWGNPLYDWERMHADGYRWWIERMRAGLQLFDLVRLDHFRGFEAFWEIPGDAPTAVHGRWVQGPGAALFEALTAALGPMPIVAGSAIPAWPFCSSRSTDRTRTSSRTATCAISWCTPARTTTTPPWGGGSPPARGTARARPTRWRVKRRSRAGISTPTALRCTGR